MVYLLDDKNVGISNNEKAICYSLSDKFYHKD